MRVGPLLIPARYLETHLGRYADHLAVWTHFDASKVRIIGSSSLVCYRGRYLQLCSAHQLYSVEKEDVCLLMPDGSVAVTSNGYRGYLRQEIVKQSDASDIACFDFSDAVASHGNLASRFFPFHHPEESKNDDPASTIALVVSGYLTTEQIFDLYENNHIGSVRRTFLAKLDSQPMDHALLFGRSMQPMNFAFDGLSGAPVFRVKLTGLAPAVEYFGMVLRGGFGNIYFLKATYIERFLNECFDRTGP